MSVSFLLDEHVPRVFRTVLQSNGYDVVRARDVFGERTDDEALLAYCEREGHLFVTHDKKDFGTVETDSHAGIVVYTDSNFLRDEPETAVRTIERVLGVSAVGTPQCGGLAPTVATVADYLSLNV